MPEKDTYRRFEIHLVVHQELQRIRGIMANNNYNASMVEDQIRKQLDKHQRARPDPRRPDRPAPPRPSETTTDVRNDTQRTDTDAPQPSADPLLTAPAPAPATSSPIDTRPPAIDPPNETESEDGIFTRTRQRARREVGVESSQQRHQQERLQPAEPPQPTTRHTPESASSQPEQSAERGKLRLFYQSAMSSAYKKEERAIQSIVHNNCIPISDSDDLKVVIYYKSPTVSNLVLKNNLSHVPSMLKSTNVVYKFKCNTGDCAHLPNRTYVGHTVTTMSRRITMHLQDQAPTTRTWRHINAWYDGKQHNHHSTMHEAQKTTSPGSCIHSWQWPMDEQTDESARGADTIWLGTASSPYMRVRSAQCLSSRVKCAHKQLSCIWNVFFCAIVLILRLLVTSVFLFILELNLNSNFLIFTHMCYVHSKCVLTWWCSMSERNVVNNRNSFSDSLYEHKPEERPLIRRIEKLNEKVNNDQAAVNFNQKIYIHIYIYI